MHGCVPDRWLTDHEFLELAADVERIGGALAMSTDAGLVPMGRGFTEIAEQIRRGGTIPPELVEHYATLTRGVRATWQGTWPVSVLARADGSRSIADDAD